jgi:hypothetical protein
MYVPKVGTPCLAKKRGAAVATLGLGILIGATTASLAFLYVNKSQSPYASVPAPDAIPEAYLAAKPLNNSCLIRHLDFPAASDHPATFDACGFVIQSTDAVWNRRGNRGDVDGAIDKYFHKDYINAGSWGRKTVGKKELRSAIYSEMRAVPDLKIHITDCVCKGNDVNGYKCAMPDVLEGTNLGPSIYGPATGRHAKWSGLVQSLVKKDPETGQWQYFAEWGVHDEWALIQQLGLDFSRVPHPTRNLEQFHDCVPLTEFKPEPTYDRADSEAQQLHSSNLRKTKRL